MMFPLTHEQTLKLTANQRAVAALLSEGLDYAAVGRYLGVSMYSIEQVVGRIRTRLGMQKPRKLPRSQWIHQYEKPLEIPKKPPPPVRKWSHEKKRNQDEDLGIYVVMKGRCPRCWLLGEHACVGTANDYVRSGRPVGGEAP